MPEGAVWRGPAEGQAQRSGRRSGWRPVRVGILLLRQTSLASAMSVYEDLVAVNTVRDPEAQPDRPAFLPEFVAASEGPFQSLTGARLMADRGLGDAARFDAVFAPTLYDDGCLSGETPEPILSAAARDWLQRQHAGGAVVATICSGAFALAEAGLLDGHAAGMIALYTPNFRRRFPRVTVYPNRSLVVSGAARELVSGGVSLYSADVSLCLITRFAGTALAMDFVRLYERPITQALEQGAALPQADVSEDRTIAMAQRFIVGHLAAEALVQSTADLLNLSERTLARRFKRATGQSPRAFIHASRMARAQRLLETSRMPIEEIGRRIGYADRAAFSTAFRKAVGLPPADYRLRFQIPANLRGVS